ASLPMPAARYPGGHSRAREGNRLLQTIQALPAVAAASMGSGLPEAGTVNRIFMEIEGRTFSPATRPTPDQYEVTAGDFATLAIPLVRGRLLTAEGDPDHAPVALVNQTAARRLWPGQDPVGARIRTGGGVW